MAKPAPKDKAHLARVPPATVLIPIDQALAKPDARLQVRPVFVGPYRNVWTLVFWLTVTWMVASQVCAAVVTVLTHK